MATINTPLEARLYAALRTIARDYQTPDQLRRSSGRDFGLDYEEALEYAYENIQQLAKIAIKGVRLQTIAAAAPEGEGGER